jgi:hypothetical protein
VPISGWAEFSTAIDHVIADADAAARATVIQGASLIEWHAKRNFEGVHKAGQPHVGTQGSGFPNVVTGTLRRSIQSAQAERQGLGTWSCKVGPTAVYGRRIELEYGYEYFGPAVEAVVPRMQEIARKFWSAALIKAGR